MMALVLSIAVLVTGTIVQTVEAKGPPPKEPKEPKSGIKFSCNDRKGVLSCKATSRMEIDAISLYYFDKNEESVDLEFPIDYTIPCHRAHPFGDSTIKVGTYVVTAHECSEGGGFTDIYEIHVEATNSTPKISSIVLISSIRG